MRVDNWFLKGLEKHGRTERYPPDGPRTVHRLEQNEPPNFRPFGRSLYLYVVDAGTCGACNLELQALGTPHYDLNRLGMFFTNTPRHADALIVMGMRSERMEKVLENAYEAMPGPKLIISLGDCACSGGPLGPPPALSGKAVVHVPGCPPDPYAILEGIMKAKEVSSE